MSDKQTYILCPYPHPSRELAKRAIDEAPDGNAVIIKDAKRSDDQNSAQWPYLLGFSKQLQWPVNGEMTWLTDEEWKDILTAAFEEDVKPRVAMGFDGGMVMLGRRTREFGKNKFSLWYEWLMAAAALKGVTPIYKNGRREDYEL
jgi:hypothetical protein